jgi:hypothetical protein
VVGSADALASAASGCYFDSAQNLVHIKLPSAPIDKPHHITISYLR